MTDLRILQVPKGPYANGSLPIYNAAQDRFIPTVPGGGSGLVPMSVLKYAEVTGVGDSTLTTVATYTISSEAQVGQVLCSGTTPAKFSIWINAVKIATQRSAADYNAEFPINLSVTSGDIVDVKVEHYHTGEIEDFEATILGV